MRLVPDRVQCVFFCICAGDLLRVLQNGFAEDGAFWREHKYFDHDTPFFSFHDSLVSGACSLL